MRAVHRGPAITEPDPTGAADPTSNERRNQRMLHLQYGALLIQPSLYRLALFMDISLLSL